MRAQSHPAPRNGYTGWLQITIHRDDYGHRVSNPEAFPISPRQETLPCVPSNASQPASARRRTILASAALAAAAESLCTSQTPCVRIGNLEPVDELDQGRHYAFFSVTLTPAASVPA